MLALVTLIHVLEEIGGLSTANVSLYCDNQQAVECNKEMSHLCSFVKFTDADYDIDRERTQAIRRAVSNISISHIRGHQDKAKDFDYDNASLETRMNIDMDFEAKTFIKTYDKKWAPTRITPFFPAPKAALLIHKNVVSKNLEEHIKLHKHGPTMEQRLVSKGIIQESHMPWIQWRGMERAMKRYPITNKIPITKLIHQKWCTEEKISEWYDNMGSTCLRCRLQTETIDHIFQCRSQNAKKIHLDAVTVLRKDLQRAKTVPLVADHLVNVVKEHRLQYHTKINGSGFYSDQIKSMVAKVEDRQRQLYVQRLHHYQMGGTAKHL